MTARPAPRAAFLLAAALTAPLAAPVARAETASAAPVRAEAALPNVVSINLCADQLLLELADPSQIRSLSRLATEPSASHHVARAAGLPTNDGSAEPVLAMAPDVVIVGEYSDRYTVRLLEARGLRLRTLPLADSVRATLDNLLRVGDWIGRPAEARARVAELEARLEAIELDAARDAPDATPLAAAVYDPNGYTVGPASLRGEMLARAGFVNIAEAAASRATAACRWRRCCARRPTC